MKIPALRSIASLQIGVPILGGIQNESILLAVPKKKTSPRRAGQRRNGIRINRGEPLYNYKMCPKCSIPVKPSFLCPKCKGCSKRS